MEEEQLIKKQIIREAPGEYSQGVYLTYMCKTTSEELNLYKFRHKRINPALSMTLAYILKKKGISLNKA